MIECPRCSSALERVGNTFEYRCNGCGGCALNLGALRKRTGARCVRAITGRLAPLGSAEIACPLCRATFSEHSFSYAGEEVRLDLCGTCAYVWFDAGELSKFESELAGVGPEERRDRLRESILDADLPPLRIHRSPSLLGTDDTPLWQWLAGNVLGLPVEAHQADIRVPPMITWSLAGYLILSFFLVNWARHISLYDFSLVPIDIWRHHGVTMVTYMFLHADLAHLIGNLSFLLLVGDDVESDLGPFAYVGLCLTAGIASGLVHAALDPRSHAHLVGASGFVSALIAYYGLRFADRPLDIVVHPLLRQRARYPAGLLLVGWMIMQLAFAGAQMGGAGTVSALGHLGGAAVGVLAWAACRART